MLNVALNGFVVLMATYEQPAKEIAQRLFSSRAGMPWESLRSSSNKLHDVSNEVGGWPIQIDDSGHDITKLVATIRLAARKGTQVVIVDYLQLVPPDDPSVLREQQVASSSRKLKQVAMACNVCVIVPSQLNRQVENRSDARPRLSDLRESGAIEQDADQTWLLWRPNKGSNDHSDTVASIDIAKNRNGPTGLIQLDWHGPTSTFHNPVSPAVEW
jgi:replicative DNA helicase